MKTLLPLLLACVVPGTVLAATPPTPASAETVTPRARTMTPLDTNGDHLISRDEAAARPALAQRFDAIDTNHDGQLSREELRDHRRSGRRAQFETDFAAADTNHDGSLSADEAKAGGLERIANRFDAIDANHDGLVSQAEIKTFTQARHHDRAWRDQAAPASSTP